MGAMVDRVLAGGAAVAGGEAARADLLAACLLAAGRPAEAWGSLLSRLSGVAPPAAGALSGLHLVLRQHLAPNIRQSGGCTLRVSIGSNFWRFTHVLAVAAPLAFV